MLNKSQGYTEAEWQVAVHNIVCVLYPKYIMAKREVYIGDDGRHKKCPDFILVDSSGFVDILEIKKPQQQRLLTNRRYRDNYVPDRDLSGAIVQIEKYIYTLNQCGRKIEKEMNNKYSEDLPEGIQIRITNPQGMLLMGRSKNFSLEEKLDLEVIKRQYKNIVDIMTYDELIERFENIIRHITKKC